MSWIYCTSTNDSTSHIKCNYAQTHRDRGRSSRSRWQHVHSKDYGIGMRIQLRKSPLPKHPLLGQLTNTEFTRGWFGFWFKSESCRRHNLTSRAWVELSGTRASSHDLEVLQVSTPGEGLRRRFNLNQAPNQPPCEFCERLTKSCCAQLQVGSMAVAMTAALQASTTSCMW